jgi:hypothetical protein
MLATMRRPLRFGDLFQRPAEMRRRCARTFGVGPGNRSIERIVEFEHAWSVAKTLQSAAVAWRQAITGDLDQLTGRNIEQICPGFRQFIDMLHMPSGSYLAAPGAQTRRQRIGYRLRSAPG